LAGFKRPTSKGEKEVERGLRKEGKEKEGNGWKGKKRERGGNVEFQDILLSNFTTGPHIHSRG